jgi:hypothetical protein
MRSIALAVGLAMVLGGGLSQRALAATTTTLTFDEFSNTTVLTTQYQSLGVTISGASVLTQCSTCIFPPVSGTNVAVAPSGSMTLTFVSPAAGSVQTVSVYVSNLTGSVGINAYDSANNLLGQATVPNAVTNTLVTVTSSGNPIAYVTIQGGAGQFAIDNFSFTYTPPSAPNYSCTGFQSPFDVALSLNSKTNRAIPLKAQLFDKNGTLVTPDTLGAAPPPVVNVSYQSGGSPATDDTSLLEPLGSSSSGNQFSFDPTTNTWWFNLSTQPFTASGTYTVTLQSGDGTQYTVSPACSGQFVR